MLCAPLPIAIFIYWSLQCGPFRCLIISWIVERWLLQPSICSVDVKNNLERAICYNLFKLTVNASASETWHKEWNEQCWINEGQFGGNPNQEDVERRQFDESHRLPNYQQLWKGRYDEKRQHLWNWSSVLGPWPGYGSCSSAVVGGFKKPPFDGISSWSAYRVQF
jgi:hypothetical protein